MSTPLQIGDTVSYTRAFLQSMAMVSGSDTPPAVQWPFARDGDHHRTDQPRYIE